MLACEAMGTRFEVVLVGSDAARLRAAGEEVLAEIRLWHERLSWFDKGSFVTRVNTVASHRAVHCDGEFFELLCLCRDVWRQSGGAFDPTVAGLMRAGGFRDLAPDQDAWHVAWERTGFEKVELDETAQTVRFTREGMGLDFGAIGKGWALDRAREVLVAAGVECALMHGGTSSVAAIGAPLGGWRVAIGLGAAEDDVGAPEVDLAGGGEGLSLGVSAHHGRMVNGAGHVMDPRTGVSASVGNDGSGHDGSGAELAAVIARSAAAADAWSTALLVAGSRPVGMPATMTSVIMQKGGQNAVVGVETAGPHANTLVLEDRLRVVVSKSALLSQERILR